MAPSTDEEFNLVTASESDSARAQGRFRKYAGIVALLGLVAVVAGGVGYQLGAKASTPSKTLHSTDIIQADNLADLKWWAEHGAAEGDPAEAASAAAEEAVAEEAAAEEAAANTTLVYGYQPIPWNANLQSIFPIVDCATIKSNGALLSQTVRNGLAADKKVKCAQVHGVLVAGPATATPGSFFETAMKLIANLIASLLDVNCDGKVDNAAVLAALNKFTNPEAPWVNVGTDKASEESKFDPGNSYGAQLWKEDSLSMKPRIVLEEVFHMINQKGWAVADFATFGVPESWSSGKQSVACNCMKEAQCTWYQHPENGGCTNSAGKACKNSELAAAQDVAISGATPGTCSTGACKVPSCDCIEFFHKVSIAWLGNQFTGYKRMGAILNKGKAQGKSSRQAIEAVLSATPNCKKLLAYMQSNAGFPKSAITGTYQCR